MVPYNIFTYLVNQRLFSPIWTMSNVDNDVRIPEKTPKIKKSTTVGMDRICLHFSAVCLQI